MRYSHVETSELVRLLDGIANYADDDEVLVDRNLLTEVADRMYSLLSDSSDEQEADPRQLKLL